MPRARTTPAALALAAAAGALLLTGCDSGPSVSVTQVDPASEAATDALTPIERGVVRREMLEASEEAVAAFLADDPARIEDSWPADYVELLAEQRAAYAAEGKVRVREHAETTLDVVEINENGTQAIAEYNFTELSHFETAEGTKLTEPTRAEKLWQLTLGGTQEDGWTVIRVIGAGETFE
jgi:hypothetical protein